MKSIFKLLGLTLFTSNFSIYSSIATSSNEISNRYQTLEGEYITIDDSMDGNLKEIEIFGNTIQDTNNLEDIQSVGDLYIDEDGEPILDSQGRKQYKIDIVSTTGFNLLDVSKGYEQGGLTASGELSTTGEFTNSDRTYNHFIKLEHGKTYSLYSIFTGSQNESLPTQWGEVSGFNENKEFVRRIKRNYGQQIFVMPDDIEYVRVGLRDNSRNAPIFIEGDVSKMNKPTSVLLSNMYLDYCTDLNKITILLPCKLMKVGNIADRLYWDNEKGRYVIEKNIGEVHPELMSNALTTVIDSENRGFVRNIWNTVDEVSVNNRKHILFQRDGNVFLKADDYGINTLYLYYNELNLVNLGYEETVESVKQAVLDKILSVYFVYSSPRLIETNIDKNIIVPTYEGKTYIFAQTESGINPTLKVAVDRLPQIVNNAIDEAKNNSTSTNISLARMYVNMLPESLYKDQLQEQLNNIFNSEIVLNRKSSSANIDIYIKSKNALIMTLSTNSITFKEFSGAEDMLVDNGVEISINSSLPYNLNAYLMTEIQNSDKSQTMDKEIFQLKEDSEVNYQYFNNINEKMILKNNCEAGNDKVHLIDFNLKGGIAHQKDIYKTTIKFEAEQK